jgi:beta-lactamase class A
METVSSNLATNLLITQVDAKRANATAHALGADSILVLRGVEDGKACAGLNNTTTARDLGVLLAAIANGTAASPASCREMLAILSRQAFNEGIPAGLPAGTRVYHKTVDRAGRVSRRRAGRAGEWEPVCAGGVDGGHPEE